MKPTIDPKFFITENTKQEFEVIPAFIGGVPEPTRTETMLQDPQTWILGANAFFLLILVLRKPSGSSKKKGE